MKKKRKNKKTNSSKNEEIAEEVTNYSNNFKFMRSKVMNPKDIKIRDRNDNWKYKPEVSI